MNLVNFADALGWGFREPKAVPNSTLVPNISGLALVDLNEAGLLISSPSGLSGG